MDENFDLTETDCGILINALAKCNIFQRAVDAGLPVSLNSKNYGFPAMTYDEEFALMKKLDQHAQVAWLRSQRK